MANWLNALWLDVKLLGVSGDYSQVLQQCEICIEDEMVCLYRIKRMFKGEPYAVSRNFLNRADAIGCGVGFLEELNADDEAQDS